MIMRGLDSAYIRPRDWGYCAGIYLFVNALRFVGVFFSYPVLRRCGADLILCLLCLFVFNWHESFVASPACVFFMLKLRVLVFSLPRPPPVRRLSPRVHVSILSL